MDGWMDGWMDGCVQWNLVYSWKDSCLKQVSNLGALGQPEQLLQRKDIIG